MRHAQDPFTLRLPKRLSVFVNVSVEMNQGQGIFVPDLVRFGLAKFPQSLVVIREQLDAMECQHLKKAVDLDQALLVYKSIILD